MVLADPYLRFGSKAILLYGLVVIHESRTHQLSVTASAVRRRITRHMQNMNQGWHQKSRPKSHHERSAITLRFSQHASNQLDVNLTKGVPNGGDESLLERGWGSELSIPRMVPSPPGSGDEDSYYSLGLDLGLSISRLTSPLNTLGPLDQLPYANVSLAEMFGLTPPSDRSVLDLPIEQELSPSIRDPSLRAVWEAQLNQDPETSHRHINSDDGSGFGPNTLFESFIQELQDVTSTPIEQSANPDTDGPPPIKMRRLCDVYLDASLSYEVDTSAYICEMERQRYARACKIHIQAQTPAQKWNKILQDPYSLTIGARMADLYSTGEHPCVQKKNQGCLSEDPNNGGFEMSDQDNNNNYGLAEIDELGLDHPLKYGSAETGRRAHQVQLSDTPGPGFWASGSGQSSSVRQSYPGSRDRRISPLSDQGYQWLDEPSLGQLNTASDDELLSQLDRCEPMGVTFGEMFDNLSSQERAARFMQVIRLAHCSRITVDQVVVWGELVLHKR